MTVLNFKKDDRIDPRFRESLRSFCSEVGKELSGLASELGVLIVEKELPLDCSGFVAKVEKEKSASGFMIVVNSNHSSERKRFTVAHELGHFVLHTKSQHSNHRNGSNVVKFETRYRTKEFELGTIEREEFEANQFAASLLMPANLVRASYRESDSAIYLSQRFKVSRGAMRKRLSDLGLVDGDQPWANKWNSRLDPHGMFGGVF